jgi:hypothetical protein
MAARAVLFPFGFDACVCQRAVAVKAVSRPTVAHPVSGRGFGEGVIDVVKYPLGERPFRLAAGRGDVFVVVGMPQVRDVSDRRAGEIERLEGVDGLQKVGVLAGGCAVQDELAIGDGGEIGVGRAGAAAADESTICGGVYAREGAPPPNKRPKPQLRRL